MHLRSVCFERYNGESPFCLAFGQRCLRPIHVRFKMFISCSWPITNICSRYVFICSHCAANKYQGIRRNGSLLVGKGDA